MCACIAPNKTCLHPCVAGLYKLTQVLRVATGTGTTCQAALNCCRFIAGAMFLRPQQILSLRGAADLDRREQVSVPPLLVAAQPHQLAERYARSALKLLIRRCMSAAGARVSSRGRSAGQHGGQLGLLSSACTACDFGRAAQSAEGSQAGGRSHLWQTS